MTSNKSKPVSDQLHSAAIHLLRRLRLEDDASGVGPAKLSALSILVFVGPRSLGELAKMEQVKPPTMSRILDGLEAEGLIKRKPVETDGRSLIIHPTAKGIKLMQDARERRIQALDSRVKELSSEELNTLQKAAALIEKVMR